MTLLGAALATAHDWHDRVRLGRLPPLACDASRLRLVRAGWLAQALGDAGAAADWPVVEQELGALGITAAAQGVNPGDRRALYCVVRALRPRRVLEIGTHIGASTVHIAAALRADGDVGELTTVDVLPVNDPATRPWEAAGSRFAPADLVARLGMAARVRFVTSPSLAFLAECPDRFDLIFLDGDHSRATVYQEFPAALRCLAPEGLVLLHDYFPGGRPLWPNGVVIAGPWVATERLRREGAAIRIEPLGTLPWPTKLGTSVTSLALASRSA